MTIPRSPGSPLGPADGRHSWVTGFGEVVLHVVEYGPRTGRPLLLVHGVGQSWLAWQFTVGGLAARGFHVVTFDLRGHGRSGHADDFSATAYDGDCAAVADATGLDRPLVVGWSLGGLIAESYLATAPVRGLVMVDTLLNSGTAFAAHFEPDMAAAIKPGLATPEGRAAFLDRCAEPWTVPEPQRTEQLTENRGFTLDRLQALNAQFAPAFATIDATTVRAGKAPVLAVHGSADRVVRPASAEEIATAAPNGTGRTLILPGHGHSSFATAPERFARGLDAFARDVGV